MRQSQAVAVKAPGDGLPDIADSKRRQLRFTPNHKGLLAVRGEIRLPLESQQQLDKPEDFK